LGTLLQRAGFALPVADLDRHTVRYDSALALMHDLRAMGATNVLVERNRRPLRRAVLRRTVEIYADRFADKPEIGRGSGLVSGEEKRGRVTATFDFVWLSGWSPDASQQKPLKPGSAKARLADALGVPERSAGERTGPGPRPKR
jgi:hypothetical protein